MNNEGVNNKLRQIKIEDHIWLIYIGIIFLSWYANELERKYYIFNDLLSKEKYTDIMTVIFTILLIIYLYFFTGSINDVKSLNERDSNKKKELTYLSFIATLFIVISGFIFLYISIVDKDIDVELAFN